MKQQNKLQQTEIGMIPEDWEIKRLKEITLQIFSGGTPNTKKEEYWNGNLLWLSSGETSQTFIRNTERKITQEGVNNSSTRLAKREDVVVAGAGQGHTRGQPSFCLIDTYINQSIVALRADKEQIKPLFLFYNLLSRYDELRQLSDAHSSRGSLTTKLLADMYIKLPTLEEQDFISKILSDLDFRIELNQQMNKTLETIGQSIFKRWFIDFEFPNEGGKPYKSSGGEMIESELGKIPKGWKVGRLGELGKVQPGFAFKSKDFSKEGFGLVKIKNIQPPIIKFNFESFIPEGLYTKTNTKFYLFSGDVLIAMTGAMIGKVGIIPKMKEKLLLNQRVGKVESHNKYLMYIILNTNEIQGLIRGGSSASSAQGNISNTDIENFIYLIPDDIFLQMINNVLDSLFIRITDNLGQIQKISEIRDSLLPRLMSGRIRVPVEVRT